MISIMSILWRIITLPILGPIDGVLWLSDTIQQQINNESWDERKVVSALTELEIDLDMGKIDIIEYDEREASLLLRLKEIQEEKND
jgi:hypothetical protein